MVFSMPGILPSDHLHTLQPCNVLVPRWGVVVTRFGRRLPWFARANISSENNGDFQKHCPYPVFYWVFALPEYEVQ
jgi:hypothetical protein